MLWWEIGLILKTTTRDLPRNLNRPAARVPSRKRADRRFSFPTPPVYFDAWQPLSVIWLFIPQFAGELPDFPITRYIRHALRIVKEAFAQQVQQTGLQLGPARNSTGNHDLLRFRLRAAYRAPNERSLQIN